jgi:hypothetical protein
VTTPYVSFRPVTGMAGRHRPRCEAALGRRTSWGDRSRHREGLGTETCGRPAFFHVGMASRPLCRLHAEHEALRICVEITQP